MFEQTFVTTQVATRRPWTVAASLSAQIFGVAILLVFPLLHPEVLRIPDPPSPRLVRVWLEPIPHAPSPRSTQTSTITRLVAPARNVVFGPSGVRNPVHSIEMPSVDSTVGDWAPQTQMAFGSLGGSTALPHALTPAPIPAPVPARPPGPMHVSEGVALASLIYGPKPAYPSAAKITRVQGIVRLEAVIGTDGAIRNLRIVSGNPLLVTAARDSVQQWRYKPTLLNGVPVEVLTEIDVNFTLQ